MINNKIIVVAVSILALSGCTAVAELTGSDSTTLNMNAAQDYQRIVDDAKAQKALDTTSSTYKRVNTVFLKMKPFADRVNQTGQQFDWKLSVLKSDELNAFVMPGGKVVFFTGIVNKLNLTDAEIAAIMGHEMTHALEEHSKRSAGAAKITDFAKWVKIMRVIIWVLLEIKLLILLVNMGLVCHIRVAWNLKQTVVV